MQSGRILIMRHAEKPDDKRDPNLSDAGRLRAQELVAYIPKTFGEPSFLFASAESKHSRRPIETLEPLSHDLGLSIDANFADQDYGALAQELQTNGRYENKLAVVCWHHGNIPSLAHALGLPDKTYPDPWDRSVFNQILDVTFVNGAPSVQEITEFFSTAGRAP